MLDFHTHILPGIDDGSRDVTETENLLREEAQQGVRHIVATPHFYAHRISVEEFLRRRSESIAKTEEHLARLVQEGKAVPAENVQEAEENPAQNNPLFIIPKLQYAAEVYYFPGMGRAEKLSRLCLEGTNLLLLEMPFEQWDEEILRDVKDILKKQKLRIVLAHLERYPEFQKKRRIFEEILDLPLTIQLNGGAFLKERKKSKFCFSILNSFDNVILGSDTHNLTSRRPNLKAAREEIKKKMGEERIRLLDETAKALLE